MNERELIKDLIYEVLEEELLNEEMRAADIMDANDALLDFIEGIEGEEDFEVFVNQFSSLIRENIHAAANRLDVEPDVLYRAINNNLRF